jgi:hypothetical protein
MRPANDIDATLMSLEQQRCHIVAVCRRVEVIIVIEVQHAGPLVSPAYDDGTTTEADMLRTHRATFARLHDQRVGQ